MGTLYIDSGGSATNSGSTDNNSADVTLTVNVAYVSGTTIQVDVNTGALTSIVTSGASQSTVYFGDATNANRKIFWITAYDNAASPKTITVDTAPTGLTAGTSTGTIGGRYAAPSGNGLNLIDGALRAGDEIIWNNSWSGTVSAWTQRAGIAGTTAGGYIKVRGKTGTRPVLNITNTSAVVTATSGAAMWWTENLELDQDGASGNVINGNSSGGVLHNLKIVDGGGSGIAMSDGGAFYIGNDISGVVDGFSGTVGAIMAKGNNIHDNSGNGYASSGANSTGVWSMNIFDSNAGRGVYDSSASHTSLSLYQVYDGNTFYGNGNSGYETADADRRGVLINNIFSENGDAAGEYNVDLAASAELTYFHGWNVFYHSGGGGGANLNNLTVNAQIASSEFTTDPQFTNAASGDFSIGSSSPAKAAGFPGDFTL